MFINIIKTYRDVVAICDAELIGKYFEEENRCLEVKENFFKGDGKKYSEQEIIKKIQNLSVEDATFNIVGEKAVNTAIKAGLVNSESVKTIQRIPIVLVLG